jgi:hypothetical protein
MQCCIITVDQRQDVVGGLIASSLVLCCCEDSVRRLLVHGSVDPKSYSDCSQADCVCAG